MKRRGARTRQRIFLDQLSRPSRRPDRILSLISPIRVRSWRGHTLSLSFSRLWRDYFLVSFSSFYIIFTLITNFHLPARTRRFDFIRLDLFRTFGYNVTDEYFNVRNRIFKGAANHLYDFQSKRWLHWTLRIFIMKLMWSEWLGYRRIRQAKVGYLFRFVRNSLFLIAIRWQKKKICPKD